MCLYPKLIKNPKYKENKKNGGIIPAVPDMRVLYVPTKCNNCMECKKQKAREWQVRLTEDIKKNTNGKFIALTFSNKSIKELSDEITSKSKKIDGYTLDNAIATLAVHRFRERHRKLHKKSIRHWLVSELGHNGTENIHLHGIIWTDKDLYDIEKIWKYGFMWKGHDRHGKLINYVNDATISYTTKYVHKVDAKHKYYKPIILTSPGIGQNYITNYTSKENKYSGIKTNETYRTSTGHKISMPTYWRNKIYNDEEREALWLHRLDKLERWICGEKIDISQNDETYFEVRKWYRKINKKLGYGSDKINIDDKNYEIELRNINMKIRKENNNNKKK